MTNKTALISGQPDFTHSYEVYAQKGNLTVWKSLYSPKTWVCVQIREQGPQVDFAVYYYDKKSINKILEHVAKKQWRAIRKLAAADISFRVIAEASNAWY